MDGLFFADLDNILFYLGKIRSDFFDLASCELEILR